MTVADNLARICDSARPLIDQRLDVDEALADLREVAAEQGLSWSAIRSILIAAARDARDGGDRIAKLAEKASLATDYIALLIVAENHEIPPQSKFDGNAPLNRAPVEAAAAPTQVVGLMPAAAIVPDDGSLPAVLRRS